MRAARTYRRNLYTDVGSQLNKIKVEIGRYLYNIAEATANEFIEDLYTRVTAKTIFKFQQWKKEIKADGNSIIAGIYLPFDTGYVVRKGKRSYEMKSALMYNNPYFKYQVQVHQPLQEALADIGIKCQPSLGRPIQPVSWKDGPPNIHVTMDRSDFVRALQRYIQKAVQKL